MGPLSPKVYPDTCILIYLVEGHATLAPSIDQRMRAVGQAWPTLVFTELTRMECRVKPLRSSSQLLLAGYERVFSTPGYFFEPMTRAVFELATQLRADHGLKTPDAVHLAAALNAHCDEFWTNDLRLANAAQGHLQIVTFESTP